MFKNSYTNFVRSSSPTTSTSFNQGCASATLLSGKEAKRIYLEEIKDAKVSIKRDNRIQKKVCHTPKTEHVTDKDLFLTVQSNNVDKLKQVLDNNPDKINVVDDYGWSLLMIACQANSIESAKELLKHNIDTSTRDKAGNSAQSLIIQNKNYILADLLLNYKTKHKKNHKIKENQKCKIEIQEYACEICNKTFPDKNDHLSSTIHNINASKGKKTTASYVIPASNKGYQIMLKVGWDKDTGLGPDGSGKIYPIRTVQKKDRKGLGHGKRKNEESKEDSAKHNNRKRTANAYQNSRIMEINFRREFY